VRRWKFADHADWRAPKLAPPAFVTLKLAADLQRHGVIRA
jgi:hypothetical protein